MFYEIVFVVELFALFFISQILSKVLSRLFLRITKSTSATIHTLFLLFFPGVVLHELAHWFVASILFVPTGDIEFVPQIQGGFVKLGSVAVAKTDPFRRFLIGIAPIIIGILCIASFFYYFAASIPGINWQTILVLYLFFEIGNTMYSSKKDMEGAVVLFIGLAAVAASLFFLGVRVQADMFQFLFLPVIVTFTKKLDLLLSIPLGIDIFLCLLGSFLEKV